MKCQLCKNGDLKKGTTIVTVEKDGSVYVFKKVPAMICNLCGNYFLSDSMTEKIHATIKKAAEKKKDIQLLSVSA
jgi:YgiT-type zinc finger domain-containing protein